MATDAPPETKEIKNVKETHDRQATCNIPSYLSVVKGYLVHPTEAEPLASEGVFILGNFQVEFLGKNIM